MPTDNVTLNAGSDGAAMRTLADASSIAWAASVSCYATTVSPGANVLEVVTPEAGLPVAQQGDWEMAVTGSVAVTGTVTANAGTNLNTSTLALEAGGNLAGINTKMPALGQALAAASVPVVLTAAQLTTLTPLTTVAVTGTFWQATQPVSIASAVPVTQSGSWNIATVTTVTTVSAVTTVGSITGALPAGTNLLGQAAIANQVGTVYNGTTPVSTGIAAISTAASGVTSLVAGVSGKKVYVLRWSLVAAGTVSMNLQSHTTTSNATGARPLVANASAGGAWCPGAIFVTSAGEGLDINLSAAVGVYGELTYVQF